MPLHPPLFTHLAAALEAGCQMVTVRRRCLFHALQHLVRRVRPLSPQALCTPGPPFRYDNP